MRRFLLLFPVIAALAMLVLAMPAHAAPPALEPSLSLTAAELARLESRKVVVRADLAGQGGTAIGIVDVAATAQRALDAIIDVPARIGEVTGLRKAERYEVTPESFGVRWEVKVLTSTVVFHIKYTVDRALGFVPYTLDASRTPNDLVRSEGSYQLVALGEGKTRIVYRSASDSGRSVPQWVENWVASESLGQQLTGIRDRAER